MQTVAAISFLSNHSLSMDVEGVNHIAIGSPIELEDGKWVAELLIRSNSGTIAMQMVADSPDKLVVQSYGV